MNAIQADWDTTRDVLHAAAHGPASLDELKAEVAARLGDEPHAPVVQVAVLSAAGELARNGFIDAPTPFDETSRIRGIEPLGEELLAWMDDEHRWNRLRPALEEALQSGLGAGHEQLSANALDSALRQIGLR